jgi:hypothetical protein
MADHLVQFSVRFLRDSFDTFLHERLSFRKSFFGETIFPEPGGFGSGESRFFTSREFQLRVGTTPERLVEKQNRALHDQRSSGTGALFHAAREFPRQFSSRRR